MLIVGFFSPCGGGRAVFSDLTGRSQAEAGALISKLCSEAMPGCFSSIRGDVAGVVAVRQDRGWISSRCGGSLGVIT